MATLRVPVVNAAGQPLGTRDIPCAPASDTGVALCSGVVNDPGVFPQLGGLVSVLVRSGAPTLMPVATAVVAFSALPPVPPALLPPPPLPAVPPPMLPPPAVGALSMPPVGTGPPRVTPPSLLAVPVIPEADSGLLLGAGLALLGLAGAWRWRRGRRG